MAPDSTRHNPDSSELTHSGFGEEHFLILHNDDFNTFMYVIDTLIEVCGHDPVQAEQCAYITHHRGSCDIKKGGYAVLNQMEMKLLDRGLLVTVE